ncbi:BadF/BadG/BcrA/BcrD ATPase family protein [Roseobacter sp. CCS2]|uniref:BadF/BadG/BcrA/BcrD ATPase family protein n=1 Tax=Roseobacter sp. CCS2 TaxID=391593 RepID=UPI000310C0A8|nr:BadF/BadG/BcrA/BcrD ATPase family protein [Roseobacter sp. CCS2]
MTSDTHVFGIDGGGTGCRVVLCDQSGRQLAEVSAGPANYTTNPNATIQNVLTAIEALKTQFRIDLTNCVAHIGLAGVMNDTDAGQVAAAMPFVYVTITDDRAISVAGALGSASGVVVSVGTGSFVAAQRNGQQRFLGGWGHVLGDQASGVWLGVQALRRTVLAEEGHMVHSDLTRHLMACCGGELTAMVSFANKAHPSDYAALAPKIIEAAQAGDPHGITLMKEGAAYLMSCLKLMNWSEADTLCLTGGIGPHYAEYLDPRARSCIQAPKGTALDGAVLLARNLVKAADTP